FTDPASSQIYTLSLHDALPILEPSKRASSKSGATRVFSSPSPSVELVARNGSASVRRARTEPSANRISAIRITRGAATSGRETRSEEHTSELQSLRHLVCRLLL